MKRRNKFSLSHYKLFSCKMGQLIPIGLTEVLPGDTIQQSTSCFIRFSPMVAPVMHPVQVKIHHWYVPLRLLWEDFESFITGGPDGLDDTVPPWFGMSGSTPGSVSDYLGVPRIIEGANLRVSSLPQRAYNLIWNEWYRDQNLQEPLPFVTSSGQDSTTQTPRILQYSAWGKDYFTTATPWEQKGIAVQVPVNGVPSGTLTFSGTGAPTFSAGGVDGRQLYYSVRNDGGEDGGTDYNSLNVTGAVGSTNGPLVWKDPKLTATFTGDSQLGTVDLNQLREAFALQRFEEHRALYGSRYVEYLRYLGIKASDARLQRPEYLGGGRSVIQFSEVLQTAADGDTPVGTMRGHGIGAIRTNRYRRFIEEHGFIMTLMTVRPISVYTQGLPRMFSRWTKEDYWQKELEHIGQQEIRNSEIYIGASDPNGTFGFTDRYDEYRSSQSGVAGEFRTLLNYWHFGREFESEPVLNADFISSPPTNRPFADQTGNDTLYVMANHSIQARRLISRKGTPI